jgi:hypothetical protein
MFDQCCVAGVKVRAGAGVRVGARTGAASKINKFEISLSILQRNGDGIVLPFRRQRRSWSRIKMTRFATLCLTLLERLLRVFPKLNK